MLPLDAGFIHGSTVRRNHRTLIKMCTFAQLYFDPKEAKSMLEEFLPYFNTSFVEGAFVVSGLLMRFFPTAAVSSADEELMPQSILPTFFHLWSLVNRSKVIDTMYIELLSRMARDQLTAPHIPSGAYGIFTKDQSALIFTAILRVLEIPVGQATSAYSASVDASPGLGMILERDPKTHPIAHQIARWIVMSITPESLDSPDSVLANLEGLIQAVETFFHPSNYGSWTRPLCQLIYYLSDFFVMRWNSEHTGEMEVPEHRKLNANIKHRFVLCLREVTFMGIYSKSSTATNFCLSTLQSLAFLEPSLILPGALQRIYPSIQGLVEVHRTSSSLRALQILSRTMISTKGFRCHVTSLLGLALPGVDANDLDKTLYTLHFLQSVCYSIPFHDLTVGHEDVSGSMIAMDFISNEVARMEQDGANYEVDYETELTDQDEELIVRSSTAGLSEFLSSFLGKVFVLLENLPDPARIRSGSPEENIINTLPATFTPLIAALSPELYDLALSKIVDFVGNHVIHQAKDAMAFICNSLCKVAPEKALKKLIPLLISAIRTEIDENGAASTRNTSTDVLPRDRGLVWNVSVLGMCIVHVGGAVLPYKQDLLDIAAYMQEKCKGLTTVHISNFIHHLLLNLTSIYTIDHSLFEQDVLARGIGPADWGRLTKPNDLDIKWHVPCKEEVDFALEIFSDHSKSAIQALTSLLDGSSAIKRDGSGKAWSDEVAHNLSLLRLLISGVSHLFDSKNQQEKHGKKSSLDEDLPMVDANGYQPEDEQTDTDVALAAHEEQEVRPTFKYADGYVIDPTSAQHRELHDLRASIGEVLHDVHRFLCENQEDDVACFTPLYTAFKCWFVDFGVEKTAHTLDRVLRLLAADIQPFKVPGLRKQYPRPLLLRRAGVYHLQRVKHNASSRQPTELEEKLLLDLAESSVSSYTEVRKTAQNAIESASKAIIGARPLLIPVVLQAFEKGVANNDYGRIKGAVYTLLYGSMAKTLARDWRYAPRVMHTFLTACEVDKTSVQKVCAAGAFQMVDFCRPSERLVVLDQESIASLAPEENVSDKISKRKAKMIKSRGAQDKRKATVAKELVARTKNLHWKTASRCAILVVSLGLRFETLAPDSLIELLVTGTVDPHPGLRGMYSGAFTALLSLITARVSHEHSIENYIRDKMFIPGKVLLPVPKDNQAWTEEYLSSFAKPETDYYIDHEYPGWLVWGNTYPAYKVKGDHEDRYDETERKVIEKIGSYIDKTWLSEYFRFLLQEPRDQGADRFRISNSLLLAFVFNLMYDGYTKFTFQEVKEMILEVYGDGSDKHKHRAAAEAFGGLLGSANDQTTLIKAEVWEFAMPHVLKIFDDGLTPENSGYWGTFLHLLVQGKDPRRCWPLVEWLSSVRLDMTSSAAFKESSKITLLSSLIVDLGWHFQLEQPVLDDFVAHIDHPYKSVREAIGQTLAVISRTRYHESYKDVDSLVNAQKQASSIGSRPYEPSEEFRKLMKDIFSRLAAWRSERAPGQQTPSAYTSGSKTVLLWLEAGLSTAECTQLAEFVPSLFMEPVLHMMDVKEDQELQSLSYQVFRHFPNLPQRPGEDSEMITALTRIGRTSPFWHQRLRILINVQIIYFRQLFLLSNEQQRSLFACVAEMLNDTQHEVRIGAAATLSGMIRCSRVELRDSIVAGLNKKFTKQLLENPLPKRLLARTTSTTSTGTNTPTPEHTRLVLTRHAAVLGLGALVQAFPYTSPPPAWAPGVLTTLANKANADPGMVGQSVKGILSDFKKTRQDTWQMDLKVSKPSCP